MTAPTADARAWNRSPWRASLWGGAAVALSIPAIAMQFTDEVQWGPVDFLVMGTMLALACGAFELAARMTGSVAYRAGVALAVLAAFVMVWVNLAVGVIGEEFNPANLMFGGVLLIGTLGAFVARFRPAGMARATVATAAAIVVAGAIGLVVTREDHWQIAVFSAGLAGLWLVAAALFRRAGRDAAHG
jgi:hypothetical protein